MMNYNECLIAEKDKEIAELKAHVERLRGDIEFIRVLVMDGAEEGFNPLKGYWAEKLFKSQGRTYDTLLATPAQSLQEHDRQVIRDVKSAMVFPSMLRKMWSGSEIQGWINRTMKKIEEDFIDNANNLTNSDSNPTQTNSEAG